MIQQLTAASTQARKLTWSTLATVWARVDPLSPRDESVRAASVGASNQYLVTMHYRADVTPKMRLSWTPYRATTAKTLEVQSVNRVMGRNNYSVLSCGEPA